MGDPPIRSRSRSRGSSKRQLPVDRRRIPRYNIPMASSSLKRMRHLLEYALLRPLAAAIGLLPRRAVWKLGGALGGFLHFVLPGRRKLARENIRRCLGNELSEDDIHRMARASFAAFARVCVDAVWALSQPKEKVLQWIEFDEHAVQVTKEVSANGRGVIAALGHLGNWEFLNVAFGYSGLMPPSVVYKPIHNPYLDAWVQKGRQASGNKMIPHRRAAREVVRHLHENRLVGIVMDQYTPARYGGVEAPFFGQPVLTQKSVAALALAAESPVVIASCIADSSMSYKLYVSDAIYVKGGEDYKEEVAHRTAEFNKMLEGEIRRAPEQYFWMHERFRA